MCRVTSGWRTKVNVHDRNSRCNNNFKYIILITRVHNATFTTTKTAVSDIIGITYRAIWWWLFTLTADQKPVNLEHIVLATLI